MKSIEKNGITGTVTATNPKLCSFTLDDKLVVNAPHLLLHNKRQKLPGIGENVSISGRYHRSEDLRKCIFLCEKSSLDCKGDGPSRTDHDLPSVIEKHRLSVVDLEKAYVNNRLIEEFIAGLRGASAEEIIISFLDVSQDLQRNQGQIDSCSGSFSLRTISDCRYVDETNEKYARFPYWTFGVHGNTEILIGYFYLSGRTGIPFFKDVKHRMPCCVLTKTNHDLLKLNGRLILIKKHRIFTEVFGGESGVAPLEYLAFSADDVIALNCLPEMESKFHVVERPNVAVRTFIKFVLLKKSSVIWSGKSAPECWLKVLIFCDGGNKREFLALNSSYTDVVAFFEVGEAYELFHDEELSPYISKEVRRLENLPCRLLSEESAVFLSSTLTEDECLGLLTIDDDEQLILSVKEARDVIKTSSKMLLSFQGVIHTKEFVDPIESRTAANGVPVGFGTLGSKTHLLHFLGGAETKLALFLNNWERLQLPLGLLPGMRVLVRNVVAQKNAYLKSTVLTTFTVLGYEPRVEFRSMNLREDFYGRGRIRGLYRCGLIPSRVLISVSASKISVRSIRMVCSKTTTLALTFFATDHSGKALIRSQCLSVLKSILELNGRQWSKFLKAVELLGGFEYGGKTCSSKDKLVLHEALHHTIAVASAFSLTNLELHCFNTEQKSDLPILNCIDVKTVK